MSWPLPPSEEVDVLTHPLLQSQRVEVCACNILESIPKGIICLTSTKQRAPGGQSLCVLARPLAGVYVHRRSFRLHFSSVCIHVCPSWSKSGHKPLYTQLKVIEREQPTIKIRTLPYPTPPLHSLSLTESLCTYSLPHSPSVSCNNRSQ